MASWNQPEIELLVADYMSMLIAELKGIPYSKTKHRQALKPLLSGRSEGSIEFKYQNLSAVLIKHNLLYISGYKPRWNYQQLLETTLLEYFKINQLPWILFEEFVTQSLFDFKPTVDFNHWKASPPKSQSLSEERKIEYRPTRVNYLELEQKNQAIGESGERLVLNYEKWRLQTAGLANLADQVRWISKEEGDGAGFDILSKTVEGKDMYIEVKTTTLSIETPIFFSKRENDFSERHQEAYHLYRVFSLRQNPKMFSREGSFRDFCRMEATGFKGFF